MRQFSGTVATQKKNRFSASVLDVVGRIYALRWLYNDSQRLTTVHSGSHDTNKEIYVIGRLGGPYSEKL